MIIKILPLQIPQFWEAIKSTIRSVVPASTSQDIQVLYVEALHALLNDKAQCFVCLDNNRILKGMILTRIGVDKVVGCTYIQFELAYAWDKLTNEDWQETYELVMLFCKKADCKYMLIKSINPRILEMAARYGFTKKFEIHQAQIRGGK